MSICWQKVSQNCYKRKKSTVEGEETAGKKFFENMRNEESASKLIVSIILSTKKEKIYTLL